FPNPGRAPKDDGAKLAGLSRSPKRGAGRGQMLLANELLKRPRAHPRRKRRVLSQNGLGLVEQVVDSATPIRTLLGLSVGSFGPLLQLPSQRSKRDTTWRRQDEVWVTPLFPSLASPTSLSRRQ